MEEVVTKLEKILGKSFNSFSDPEKALVVDLYEDTLRRRYSPIFSADKDKLKDFFDYVYKIEHEKYSNLSNGVRWALEDVFFERV